MAAAKSTGKNAQTYGGLETELREIIDWFDGDSFDVDEAVRKYKRGLVLIKELEAYLATAENTVRELKASFNTGAK